MRLENEALLASLNRKSPSKSSASRSTPLRQGDLAEKLHSKSFATIMRLRRLFSGVSIERLRDTQVGANTRELEFLRRSFFRTWHTTRNMPKSPTSVVRPIGRLPALFNLTYRSLDRPSLASRNRVFRSNFVQSPIKRKGRKRRTERWRFFRLHGGHSRHVVLES